MSNDFIEQRIVEAVRFLLAGRVNTILQGRKFDAPVIGYRDYCGSSVIPPEIMLAPCERAEKEQHIQQAVYSVTIAFTLPPSPESELCCYAFAGAVGRAVFDNPTLGGLANWCSVTGKKFMPPKKQHIGEEWRLV